MVRRIRALAALSALAFMAGSVTFCGGGAAKQQGGGNDLLGGADSQWASNAPEVARFADEVPFGPEAQTHDKTTVRKAPGGEVIATLPGGTDVTKLAAHSTEDLVCFDDPKSGLHMAGWVAQSSLEDTTPPGPPPGPAPGPLPTTVDDGGTPPPSPTPTPKHHHHKPKPGRH